MSVIRKLCEKDAKLMYKCFNDKNNLKYMKVGYIDFTLDDCKKFIKTSLEENKSDFAIVNELDDWCGTISLKNINHIDFNAEYAIVTSKYIQGTGLALKATKEIIEYGFKEMKLKRIYLNVLKENERANHFYLKCGFKMCGLAHSAIRINEKYYDLAWYEIINYNEQGE